MARCIGRLFVGVLLVLLTVSAARAAHPLITDDTGTQGKGKFQIELNGDWATDKENAVDGTVREKGTKVSGILSAGVRENIDLVLSTPYQWVDVREPNIGRAREDGFGDTVFEVKWRFFEQKGWSLGIKPGIIIPTADDEDGLGAGKVGYSTYFIAQREQKPWEFLMNLGYKRNENKLDERLDLWHASLAAEYEIAEHLDLVGNIGIETSADKGSATDPAVLILGVIYEVRENLDVALGVKYGLNKSGTDFSVLPGIAVRF